MAVLSSPKSNKASESQEDHPSASPSTVVSHGTQEEDDDDDDDDEEEEDDEEEDRSQQTPTGTKKEDKSGKENSNNSPETLYGEKATTDNVYVEPWKGGPWSQDEVSSIHVVCILWVFFIVLMITSSTVCFLSTR